MLHDTILDPNLGHGTTTMRADASTTDDTRMLRNAYGRFTTGVTIVTTGTPDGPVGITANSFSSVSLDPPLVLWSIDRKSRRFAPFANCTHYAVHVLAADQADLCWRFAKNGTDFAGFDLAWNADGVPLLPRSLARFECEVANRVEAGDHLVLLGKVLELETQDGAPLVFARGRCLQVGGVD
jgi:flavin reductase (DIM6/NTAB) family NADH-FMN oxidoreductase RutF